MFFLEGGGEGGGEVRRIRSLGDVKRFLLVK